MARNLKEYLRQKGRSPKKDWGKMYFCYWDKDKREVGSFEQEIWGVEETKMTSSHNGQMVDTPGERYRFKEQFPYDITIWENHVSGAELGMASGFGDLLRWKYYGFLSAQRMEDKYFELTQRYPKEWDDADKLPPQDFIMPCE